MDSSNFPTKPSVPTAGGFDAIGTMNGFEGSLENYTTILDNLPVGVMLKGKDFRYVYCNETYAEYIGVPKNRIIEKLDTDIFEAGVAQQVMDADRQILEGTLESTKTIWNLGNADVGDKWVTMRKRPLLNVRGEVSCVLGVMEDIDDDSEAHIQMNLRDVELKRAIEAEQKANRAKSDFVSNVSHEMRTPLNAIIGMTQIARETRDPQKIDYCMQKIGVASAALLSNINNILDMSKIEAGKLELDYVEFSLEKTIENVCNVISVRANEKRQILRISISPDIPEYFAGDAVRLGQVFMNLLSNAVKFTPNEGKITLAVELLKDGGKTSTIKATVRDTGIGMTEEEAIHVFEPYMQAESGGEWRSGGTGLGLSITQNIVELMDGGITVDSAPNQGSTFVFQVELRNVHGPVVQGKHESGRALHILVGDPYMEAESEYYNLLNGKNVDIVFVKTQPEILQMMDENAFAKTPFDTIFFDFDIIKTSGIHIIQQLQERFGRQKIVLVVAGTQFREIEQQVGPGEVEKMLPRPLFSSSVRQAVDELTGHTPMPKDAPCYNCAGKRVLLAEDVADNAEILNAFLEKQGIRLDWAQNGEMAIEMFRVEEGGYDLVLMDLQMPVMDGYQATRQIRRMEAKGSTHTPIIAITANVFREDLDRCMAAGMDDTITKPFDKERVLDKIGRFLARGKEKDNTEDEAFFEDDNMWREHMDVDVSRLPLVDFSEGMERMEGNVVLYVKLMNGFAEGRRWREFKRVWESGDREKLSSTAHMIKGLAGNLAFIRLKYRLAAFENELRAGKSPAHSYSLVDECFKDTIDFIKNNSRYLKRKQGG